FATQDEQGRLDSWHFRWNGTSQGLTLIRIVGIEKIDLDLEERAGRLILEKQNPLLFQMQKRWESPRLDAGGPEGIEERFGVFFLDLNQNIDVTGRTRVLIDRNRQATHDRHRLVQGREGVPDVIERLEKILTRHWTAAFA